MSESTPTLCITCGLQIGDPPQLNRLKNGQTCSACRERVLHSIPPALPHPRHVLAERGELESATLFDVLEAPDGRDRLPGHGF